MARKYDVKGTQTYLICAIVCFLFGVWHLYDGWFPRPAVLLKHPKEVIVEAPQDGIIADINYKVGDEVATVAPILTVKPSNEGDTPIKVSMSSKLADGCKVKTAELAVLNVEDGESVKAGQELAELTSTRDSFYLYNKTTAVIFLIATAVCAYIHKVAK